METIIEQWTALQTQWARRVEIPEYGQGYVPQDNDLLLTLDIQYGSDVAYIAGDVQRWDGASEGIFLQKGIATEPYIPQFFAFREGPLLKNFIENWVRKTGLQANVLLIDGHGTAHPRQFGVACWVGVEMNLPSMGCAKDTLVRYEGILGQEKGSILPILSAENAVIGHILRTQTGIKPNFVSSGHQVSQLGAVDLVQKWVGKYRIPEPLRRADMAARIFSRTVGQMPTTMNVDGKDFRLFVL